LIGNVAFDFWENARFSTAIIFLFFSKKGASEQKIRRAFLNFASRTVILKQSTRFCAVGKRFAVVAALTFEKTLLNWSVVSTFSLYFAE